MRRLSLEVLILLTTISSVGQPLRRPVAAPYISSNAYSLKHVDVFSFTGNQASLAQLKYAAAGVYGERRFMLSEINNYYAAAGVPTRSGNFGLKAGYSGFSDYNETQIGLAYARQLGSKLDLGIQFNYNGIRIAGYGNATAVSFEGGTILHLSDKLHTGFHVNNPIGGKFGREQQEKLPAVYTVGFGYDASEKFCVSAELIKEEDQPVTVNAGMHYTLTPKLSVRAGMSSATSLLWMTFGLLLNSVRVDIATSYHPQLGISPGLLFIFNLKRKED